MSRRERRSPAPPIITNLTDDELSAVHHSCKIEWEPYHQGETRYRVLRIPYVDQIVTGKSPFLTSRFQSPDPAHPLHIRGAVVYAAFSGPGPTRLDTCLTHRHSDGSVFRQACQPVQTWSSAGNYLSPGFVGFDWLVGDSDYVDATCTASGTRLAGCAYFLLAEIPPNVPTGPESVFRDYNFIPRQFLEGWCSQRAVMGGSSINRLCAGTLESACDEAARTSKCLALFPEAD